MRGARMTRSPISASCKLTRQGNPGFASTIKRRAPFCASSWSSSEKSGSNCASGTPTIRKFVFMATRSTTLSPPNTRFLRLFFADFLQSHVLPVKLGATGIRYARRFERDDDVLAGGCDCACASVSGAVLEREFDGSFGSDFAVAVGDWL